VNKNSFDYLNQIFFREIFHSLRENLLYVEATKKYVPIAGSLFFYDDEKIYGRYWGSKEYIPNLHFELCYYQGIEFAIEKKISVFEAGAQGEHKIARGFRPTLITSAHKINHPGFSPAIEQYLKDESVEVKRITEELMRLLPFARK
jgi:predicted N-acyltransferase